MISTVPMSGQQDRSAQKRSLARSEDRPQARRACGYALLLSAAFGLAVGGPRFVMAEQRSGSAQQRNRSAQRSSGKAQQTSPNEAAQKKVPTGEAPVPELSFTTRVDKTAVWVGDQFHYQITVDHSPKIQFVLENVNKDTINLDPLRVVDATSSTIPLKNGKERLFVDLTLANFTTGVAEIQVPQLTLFYFRKDGAAAAATSSEGAAAESVTIPGPVIGMRSTLPPDPSDLRDSVTVTGWARNRRVVVGVGWWALIMLVIGVGWEAAHVIRYSKGRKGPDPRKAMAAIHDRWSQSVPGDFTDASVVMEFYGRSYQDLKEYLGYLLETHTEGLTADDMREEMRRLAANPDLAERAVKVLGICETARYGRDGKELIGEAARGVAHDIREIFQAGS